MIKTPGSDKSSVPTYLLLVLLGLLMGGLGLSLADGEGGDLRRFSWSPEARWIAYDKPCYRLYARHTFYVSGPARTAWIRLAADSDFMLWANGQVVGKEINVGTPTGSGPTSARARRDSTSRSPTS